MQLFITGISLAVCIFFWIKKPFGLPFSVTALIFLSICVCTGVPLADAFSGFASSAFWTLVPALFFGFVLSSTGLGKRIAYYLLTLLRVPTLPKLLAIFILIGIILSLLTPSLTVRVVILVPIAINCADICGFEKMTKERSALLVSVWLSCTFPGMAWLTGTLNGPIFMGLFQSAGLGEIFVNEWINVSFLPIMLTFALTIIVGYIIVRPGGVLKISHSAFKSAFAEIGPAKRSEIITGIILIGCFIMFVTRSLHGIPDAIVFIAGFVFLFVFGVIRAQDISSGINWDLTLFIGAVMGFGSVFEQTGLSAWLINAVSPVVAPVANANHGLFLLFAMLALFLWRFADIAYFIPTFAIVIAMLPGFEKEFGINPYVWIPILSIASNTFLMSYTNVTALIAEKNSGESGWDKKTFSKYSIVYCIAAVIAVSISQLYWDAMGLI